MRSWRAGRCGGISSTVRACFWKPLTIDFNSSGSRFHTSCWSSSEARRSPPRAWLARAAAPPPAWTWPLLAPAAAGTRAGRCSLSNSASDRCWAFATADRSRSLRRRLSRCSSRRERRRASLSSATSSASRQPSSSASRLPAPIDDWSNTDQPLGGIKLLAWEGRHKIGGAKNFKCGIYLPLWVDFLLVFYPTGGRAEPAVILPARGSARDKEINLR